MMTPDYQTACELEKLMRCAAARAGDPDQAARSFSRAMAPLLRTRWPDIVWQSSRLMAGGPVEILFSSADEALRYTLEVAPPEMEEGARLDAACALLALLGHAPPPSMLLAAWRAMQAGGALQWGAWLGIVHRRTGSRAKLYLEVPRGTRLPSAVGVSAALTASRLHMIGYEPDRRRIEYYFVHDATTREDFERLLTLAAPGERERLVAALCNLCAMPLAAVLGWIGLGHSVAFAREQEARLTLFLRAGAVPGGAAAVRHAFFSRQHALSRPVSSYEALLGGLCDEDLPDHGVVALSATRGGEIEMRVGMNAVELARRIAAVAPCDPPIFRLSQPGAGLASAY